MREFGDRVHFVTLYSREAHPYDSNPAANSRDAAGDPVVQPLTYVDRAALAAKAAAESGITMRVLVDEMDDPVWCTYGRMPNMAYLIGTDGRIDTRQEWNDPAGMRDAIRRYLAASR